MSRSRWIALVPLAEALSPPTDQLLAELARHDGGTPAEGQPPRVSSETDNSINLAWSANSGDSAEATANITLVKQPIPWEQLEGPCATAWYWPEAESMLRNHSAHLFVTLYDESKQAILQATRMTRLCCSIGATTPAVGIFWGASGGIHEPGAFAQLAGETTTENLPLNLWIDFRVYELDSRPGFGLFTTGLDSLGHREIEVPEFLDDPQKLIAGVYNVTHYLLDKDASLKQDEVIGLPDETEVVVHEERSMIDPEQEVVRLEFK